MSNIDEKLLDAIDIIVKAKIENMSQDKTIIAQILSCEDQENGKYKCLYQGNSFFANASYPLMKFQQGDNVYVLIVAADATNNSKIIIGKRY